MAFPSVTYTNDALAASGMQSNAAAAGLQLDGLSQLGQCQSIIANLLKNDPSTVSVPAGDVASGTFGSLIPDTGTYGFPSAFTFVTFGRSTTAFATPSALTATQWTGFASAVNGAVLMGFGSTNDVALKNRAGTTVLGVTANSTGIVLGGALAVAGAVTGVTTLATSSTINGQTISATANFTGSMAVGSSITVPAIREATGAGTMTIGGNFRTIIQANNSNTILFDGGVNQDTIIRPYVSFGLQLCDAAAASLVTIAGTAYGAGVASLRLNGLTTGAAAALGTLTNAPSAGNPNFWIPINIAGTVRYIPAW